MTDELEIRRIAHARRVTRGSIAETPDGQGCALLFVGMLVLAVTVVLTVWLG